MQPKTHSRFYALDFARGLSAIGIVIFHIFAAKFHLLRGLFFFVDFFFVLSGFVLAKSLINLQDSESEKKFLKSRVLRLFPMALSGVLFVVAIQLFIDLKHLILGIENAKRIDTSIITLLPAITLTQVFYAKSQLLLFPLWSLSAEWITNIISIFFMRKKRLGIFLYLFIGIVLTFLGLNNFELGIFLGSSWSLSLGRSIFGFAIGILTYKIYLTGKMKNIKIHTIISTSIILFLYVLFLKIGMNFLYFSPLVFGYAVLSLSSVKESYFSLTQRRICAYFGKLSFGIYVWHIPMLNLWTLISHKYNFILQIDFFNYVINFVVTLILSIFLTNIVIKYVEIPIRRKFR